jgi:hypothetical protein
VQAPHAEHTFAAAIVKNAVLRPLFQICDVIQYPVANEIPLHCKNKGKPIQNPHVKARNEVMYDCANTAVRQQFS